MENNDETIKSEIGTEAAWRGFSTQTLYIAKRLLEAENTSLSLFSNRSTEFPISKTFVFVCLKF